MKKIRRDSIPVKVCNDGLIVFLYDQSNSKRIKKACPTILSGFGEDDVADPTLAELASIGVLVAYELEQDDDLAIEVSLGSPLTDKERSKGRWRPVQRAPISLPSGKLCIEGYDTLRLSPDYDPKQAHGVVLDITPGEYVLSLYRIDWETLQEAGLGDDIEWGGPWQLIVLTNAVDADPVTKPAPMLRIEGSPVPVEEWVEAYKIKAGVFRGLIRFEADVYDVNLNPKAAETLGLKPGTNFHINVENPKLKLEGVYLGENIQSAMAVRKAVSKGPKTGLWEAQWVRTGHPDADYLFFQLINGKLDVGPEHCGRWVPAEITLSTSILENGPTKRSSGRRKRRR